MLDPADAEGLDRPQGGRRPARRGHVARRTRCRSPTSATTPTTCACSRNGCAATGPRSSSTTTAPSCPSSRRSRRADDRRMSANPHANGGALLRDLVLPDFRDYAVEVEAPGDDVQRGDAGARRLPARRDRRATRTTSASSARTRPPRTGSTMSSRSPTGLGGGDRADRREPRSRRASRRSPLRAPLPGLARGLPADGPARALQLLRGVHPHRRLDVQPAREVAEGDPAHPLAPAGCLAQLPPQLARLAPGPQRLLAPGPGVHRPRREQEGGGDPRLPAAGREHAPLGRRPLPAQPQLRERDRCG